ncbi:hypothetical protein M514_21701 [Trichuris suis]|uniref:Phospholipid/glycerol acyltransferase domain-containing protein n=1 Tax=Trichuris suis TaxID=68888 RepID=A0A085N9P1_9BILA|nr:hypothetical protein M514_21701 [Trichuris suis]
MLLLTIQLVSGLKPFIIAGVVGCTSVPFFCAAIGWRILASFSVSERTRVMVDDMMYSIYQRFLLLFFENVSGVELILYSAAETDANEKALYICNHQSSFDWAVFDMLAIRQNRLGSLRYILKDSLQYLPLYGWYFFATSLVLFPEGTRFHPSKRQDIAKSRQLAIEADVMPPQKTLLPRFRGMHLMVENLGDAFDAVYDVTIVYECVGQQGEERLLAPGLFEVVCGSAFYKIHVHVDRIPMYLVPRNERSLKRWLYGRFAVKDNAIRNFLDNGAPFAERSVVCKPIVLMETLPSALLLSAATVALLCTSKGRRFFVSVWTLGSLTCLLSMKLRQVA